MIVDEHTASSLVGFVVFVVANYMDTMEVSITDEGDVGEAVGTDRVAAILTMVDLSHLLSFCRFSFSRHFPFYVERANLFQILGFNVSINLVH
jgi:hypothetical protein